MTIADLKDGIDTLNQTVEDLNLRAAVRADAEHVAATEIRNLREQLDEAISTKDAAHQKIKQLESLVRSTKGQLIEAQATEYSARETIADLRSDLRDAQALVVAADVQSGSLGDEVGHLHKTVSITFSG